jgi:hypothetical protein
MVLERPFFAFPATKYVQAHGSMFRKGVASEV